MCSLTVSYLTDLFGGYGQQGMLCDIKIWEKQQAGTEDLSNPQGDIVRTKVRLPLVFSTMLGDSVKIVFWITNSVVDLYKA